MGGKQSLYNKALYATAVTVFSNDTNGCISLASDPSVPFMGTVVRYIEKAQWGNAAAPFGAKPEGAFHSFLQGG